MRLMNTVSKKLEEFPSHRTPPLDLTTCGSTLAVSTRPITSSSARQSTQCLVGIRKLRSVTPTYSMFRRRLRQKLPHRSRHLPSAFTKSRWFTRGWTLQELLAPSDVIFVASDWTTIGRRADLVYEINTITEIPTQYSEGRSLQQASIAQRMSWVAKLSTSKEEDIAYCLLEILNIHMSLLYGERR